MAKSLLELIAEKKKSLKRDDRQKVVKPPEGRSKWRILPSWRPAGSDGSDQFWHDFGQHFIKDLDGQLKAVYVCTDKTFGKPCEICSALSAAIKNAGDDDMIEKLKQSKAGGSILVNAIQVDGANPNEPQILGLAAGAFADFLNILQDEDIGGVDVLNLEGGRDIIIERTGKGLNTKYTLQPVSKATNVNPDVMKKITNLDEYVAQESAEQQARALANLNAVAGMLPPPSAAKPSLADLDVDAFDADDADLAAIEGSATKVAAEPAPAAAKPAAAPVEAASTGDSELDDLLAELG